jgi:hypothetical protein
MISGVFITIVQIYRGRVVSVAFVSALSKRSRNRLNEASRSAIPDFPDTRGRNSTNAASTPFLISTVHNGGIP